MFNIESLVYSKTLNRALWINDLLQMQDKKDDFTLFATNNDRITNPNHMSFSSIEEVDRALVMKQDFYRVTTKSGFSIEIPDNNKVFLEAKAPDSYKESHILYNANLLKNIIAENKKVLLRIAIPTFFTETEYDKEVMKKMDRDGAILALFLSSYSNGAINNPFLKFALHEKPFIKKIQNIFTKEFKIDEFIRDIFGDEVYHDLRIETSQYGYKYIIEDKHKDLYMEILNNIFYPWERDTFGIRTQDLGFGSQNFMSMEVMEFLQTELPPRTIYSFIYHLLKIESFNYDFENFYGLKIYSPDLRLMVKNLALIGNILLDIDYKNSQMILNEKYLKKPSSFIYDEIESITKLTATEKEEREFAKISIPLNRLIVNGFSTYIED